MAGQHRPSAREYGLVWLLLLALTATTWGVAKVNLGSWNVVVALSIATVKSGLVLAVFMHLKHHVATNRAFVAMAVCFLVLMTGLILADTAQRLPSVKPSHEAFLPLETPEVSPER